MRPYLRFNPKQLETINDSVAMAEELVGDYYKMSANQWSRLNYDIKTLADLKENEIVDGPFAQVIRYIGQRKHSALGTSSYDFYKICIQDHAILAILRTSSQLELFPFILYITTHEIVHIVRFSKFIQGFEASPKERMREESRVHKKTREILTPVIITGLEEVLRFYKNWPRPLDELEI